MPYLAKRAVSLGGIVGMFTGILNKKPNGMSVYQSPPIDTSMVYHPVNSGIMFSSLNFSDGSISGLNIDEKAENLLRQSMKHAALAAANISEIEHKTCVGCADSAITSLRNITAFSSSIIDGQMQGYMAVDDASKSIIIAFRGSSNVPNWISNAIFDKTASFIPEAQVHQGFAYSYRELKPNFQQGFEQLILANPLYGIKFVGHSLGGALATLAAMDAMKKGGYLSELGGAVPSSRVSLITFGSPRVGDKEFAQKFSDLKLGNQFRVVNGTDLVPHMPPLAFGFRHILGETFLHPDKKGQAQYCDDFDRAKAGLQTGKKGEDTNCASSMPLLKLRTESHSWCFGWSFSSMISKKKSG